MSITVSILFLNSCVSPLEIIILVSSANNIGLAVFHNGSYVGQTGRSLGI
jgi:hypothetical protein